MMASENIVHHQLTSSVGFVSILVWGGGGLLYRARSNRVPIAEKVSQPWLSRSYVCHRPEGDSSVYMTSRGTGDYLLFVLATRAASYHDDVDKHADHHVGIGRTCAVVQSRGCLFTAKARVKITMPSAQLYSEREGAASYFSFCEHRDVNSVFL